MFGELIPKGGGDPIPLVKQQLRVGRRESCDVVLRFANVSAYHCLLTVEDGYWFVKDLNSRNGIKVNGSRVPVDMRKRLDPGDELSVAKHWYEVKYVPAELGAIGAPPAEQRHDSVLNQSLLERAGLDMRRKNQEAKEKKPDPQEKSRINLFDDSEKQLKNRRDDENKPT